MKPNIFIFSVGTREKPNGMAEVVDDVCVGLRVENGRRIDAYGSLSILCNEFARGLVSNSKSTLLCAEPENAGYSVWSSICFYVHVYAFAASRISCRGGGRKPPDLLDAVGRFGLRVNYILFRHFGGLDTSRSHFLCRITNQMN